MGIADDAIATSRKTQLEKGQEIEHESSSSSEEEVVRDPRFESLCSALDEEGFSKRYSFPYQENLPAEKVVFFNSLIWKWVITFL
ncbi:uncharacterized protein LOC120017038 isoform X2 [Tripterygium wilfordii]|uniref:uncharacterized protein LOC120017038 isoform X2 n=1 Tax=Tripterygium wilfordii TaxID=458696 RepID=UPI0018F7F82A|nr:uncharacterized protein LOC120017038 isoform X2 [Tripterygium wilfordii]XP_038726009.1 uncharacterized protein LOC120017038 isoform X2 [Tripterygium wilfordii]XP_038726010.1 uncharacterized protein LOC120017038 isoform X2 [Tripterygium wilfordii]